MTSPQKHRKNQVLRLNPVLGDPKDTEQCKFARRNYELIMNSFAPTRAGITGEDLEDVLAAQAADAITHSAEQPSAPTTPPTSAPKRSRGPAPGM